MWTFHTIYQPKIWGGQLIAALKGIESPFATVGESWEISAIPGLKSVVKSEIDTNRTLDELLLLYRERLLGENNFLRFGNRFPLLVKFIDAANDLSVQVHPDDAMAIEEGEPNGKTEMWYVVRTKPGSRIANGFLRPVDPAIYDSLLETGEIENWLRYSPTSPGMSFLIPAGRVHAIGGGNLICEIQQTSDTTYRLYDYRRRDEKGQLRELHTAQAFRALDFNDCGGESIEIKEITDGERRIVECPEFSVNLIETGRDICRDYGWLDSFVILVAVKGDITLTQYSDSEKIGSERILLREGEAALIPAVSSGLTIEPEGDSIILESYIDSGK